MGVALEGMKDTLFGHGPGFFHLVMPGIPQSSAVDRIDKLLLLRKALDDPADESRVGACWPPPLFTRTHEQPLPDIVPESLFSCELR